MPRRFITLFVLTNDTSRPRQFKIRFKVAKALTAGVGVFTLLMAFVVYDYVKIKGHARGYYRLLRENASQRIELQDFSSKMRDMEEKLARLEVFDKKLRIIANIEEPRDYSHSEQVMGIGGGSSADTEDYFTTPGAKVDELVKQMSADLTQLEMKADSQESRFTELHEQLMDKSSFLAATPSIWPAKGWVTSRYGKRLSPFTGLSQMHSGVDIANRLGTTVVAPADGMVVRASRDANLGKTLTVKHGYGVETVYGHLSEINVKVGQKVKRGQQIAAVGNTGRSTGSHLHYAVSVDGVF